MKNEWRVLSSQTIGVEFATKIVKIGTGSRRKRIKLQLWDTAGTERFRSVSRSYYRGAAGAVLLYDVASQASFRSLSTFLLDARALASPHLTMILAGNKSDLSNDTIDRINNSEPPPTPSSVSSKQSGMPFDTEGSGRSHRVSVNYGPKWTVTTGTEGRKVAPETASEWASRSGIPLALEVSALSGANVDDLFTRLASMILTKIELGDVDPDDPRSGIQYGDGGSWNGTSMHSDAGFEGDSIRRRPVKSKAGVGVLRRVASRDSVFHPSKTRSGRGCC